MEVTFLSTLRHCETISNSPNTLTKYCYLALLCNEKIHSEMLNNHVKAHS